MRLLELTRPDSHEADKLLQNAGYKKLGTGSYANVYAKEGDPWVLKLFENSDDPYVRFVEIVKKNPNPFFPKFKGKIINITPHYSAIRIERLSEVEHYSTEYTELAGYLDYACYGDIWGMKPSETQLNIMKTGMKELESKNPGITNAVDILAANMKPYRSDLHDNNLMKRGNQLVITDPFMHW
jgi:hypothetical protein